jgi:hypothetical protein
VVCKERATKPGGLIWLGWRLLEQDRALAVQRLRERREDTAARIPHAELSQELTNAELLLTDPASARGLASAEDALVVFLGSQALEVYPPNRLFYYPFVPAPREPPESLFFEGEKHEFRDQNYGKAIAVFHEQAVSPDPMICVGAYLRLARNYRKAGQLVPALAAYEKLAQLGEASIGGLPADLSGRRARCALLVGSASRFLSAQSSLSRKRRLGCSRPRGPGAAPPRSCHRAGVRAAGGRRFSSTQSSYLDPSLTLNARRRLSG